MTIEPGICASFKLERWEGIHDFTTDVLKLALFDENVTLTPDTTAYSSTNEVSGSGYTAGGATLAIASGFPKLNTTELGGIPAGRMVLLDFDDLTFSAISASPRCGLIYNSSKANRAVAVVDFGIVLTLEGQDLVIQWPTPDPITCIIRSY